MHVAHAVHDSSFTARHDCKDVTGRGPRCGVARAPRIQHGVGVSSVAELPEPNGTEDRPGPARLRLTSALLVVITGAFVTGLILFTGDLRTYWPLYLIPIVIAALTYHVGGALVACAAATALVAFLSPGTSGMLRQIAVGMVTFVLSGAVIGVQARRQQRHSLQLERLSVRDELTGLYTADVLHSRLGEELRRSDRYWVMTALAIVSVEDFAAFKERFGHYKGDLLLEHMADVLRIAVRETDIIARYGPTQFAIILPFSDSKDAAAVAARIEEAMARTEFEGDVLEPVARCSVSVAVASYPEEAAGQAELVRKAEQRLPERPGASASEAESESSAASAASAAIEAAARSDPEGVPS